MAEDEDVASYIDRLLNGPVEIPDRRYRLVDGVMEPVDPIGYQPHGRRIPGNQTNDSPGERAEDS